MYFIERVCVMYRFIKYFIYRFVKNCIGFFDGYGSCPNCGDRWNWKTSGSITFEGDCSSSSGVMVCNECLSEPPKLVVDRIVKDLKHSMWPQNEIESVKMAINTLKATHT